MSLATVYSRSRLGINAPLITIEVHLSNGLPSLSIVGLPETAVRESKDRVRSAILNSQFEFPARRITINLAPADLPKQGGQFDLAIALGVLAASNQIPTASLGDYEFIGELSLNGELRSTKGSLPAAIACAAAKRKLICCADNALEASLSEATSVLGSKSLLQTCAHLCGQTLLTPIQAPNFAIVDTHSLDLLDVKGQLQAKRALEIAAAGKHHLLLFGPPGTGKSMLASRLPSILPPLTQAEAIDVAQVLSITNSQPLSHYPARPFSAPHHTASAAALVGGGSQPQPGEITVANHGVLFLDELPEFQRQVLEVLREPLENGFIRISRACAQVEFPAQFQLIAAMNPCPCGYYGYGNSNNYVNSSRCQCSAEKIRRYRSKVSGPLLDRIDLHVPVQALKQGELHTATQGDSSATIQQRVLAARKIQLNRQGHCNALLSSRAIDSICRTTLVQQKMLDGAMEKLGFSARALHRILKVARTIADLESTEIISDAHLHEALAYRLLDRQQQ
jgi:magnesium chelatase family protein